MGLVVFILYFIFSICVLVYGFNLISFMNLETNDINAMKTYLQLETIAFMIGNLSIIKKQGFIKQLSIIKTSIRRCTLRNFVIIMKITDSLKDYFS